MEVKKFKALIAEKCRMDTKPFDILYDNRVLIDPISLVDAWGTHPAHRNLYLVTERN